VRGTAQISINIAGAHKTGDGRPRTEAELIEALTELLDPDDYPALSAVHAAETRIDVTFGETTLPAELSFGVDRFLDGIEAWTSR
jgi:hypothetical protein